MTPPPETLEHAIEALRRSGKPLTARQILELIPPPSRVAAERLDVLLGGDARPGENLQVEARQFE